MAQKKKTRHAGCGRVHACFSRCRRKNRLICDKFGGVLIAKCKMKKGHKKRIFLQVNHDMERPQSVEMRLEIENERFSEVK